jgi:hypothetical protein
MPLRCDSDFQNGEGTSMKLQDYRSPTRLEAGNQNFDTGRTRQWVVRKVAERFANAQNKHFY